MSREWYNSVAVRNGGYKSDAEFLREGISGEVEFEKMLISFLPRYDKVLDIGCGHGEFTLKMAKYAQHITGGDNAEEMIKIANRLLDESEVDNVDFKELWTHEEFPFEDETFDLIYNRRGPTSILRHSQVLKKGAKVIAIHSDSIDFNKIRSMMDEYGFEDLTIEEFNDCYIYFENIDEMGKFLASSHGNPDYTQPDHREELKKIAEVSMRDGRLAVQERRFIWSVKRKA